MLGIVLAIGSIIGGQALEGKLKDIKDRLFKKGVQLIVDGTDPQAVHEILEIEVEHHEKAGNKAAKVREAAGSYAPTVGILGAVLVVDPCRETQAQISGHM